MKHYPTPLAPIKFSVKFGVKFGVALSMLCLLAVGVWAQNSSPSLAPAAAPAPVKPLTPPAFGALIGVYQAEDANGLYAQMELTKEQCMPVVYLERRAHQGDIALRERYDAVNFDAATLGFALIRADSPHGLTASMSPEQPADVLILVDQSEAGTFVQRFVRVPKP